MAVPRHPTESDSDTGSGGRGGGGAVDPESGGVGAPALGAVTGGSGGCGTVTGGNVGDDGTVTGGTVTSGAGGKLPGTVVVGTKFDPLEPAPEVEGTEVFEVDDEPTALDERVVPLVALVPIVGVPDVDGVVFDPEP